VAEEQPLRRWQIVLAACLLVWEPLRTIAAAGPAFQSLYVRGSAVLLVLLLRCGVAALGVAAGAAIFNARPHARGLAIAALAAALAADLFVYLTPFFPNNRMPGDTPWYIAASLVYNGAWITAIAASRRAWP
jgi:hypothetical protein